MIEAGSRRSELLHQPQVQLFDEIPRVRQEKGQEDSIRQSFDGTYRQWAVVIDLGQRGELERARLYNLLDGNIRSYEKNQQGQWRSNRGTIEVGSGLDKRLHVIGEAVQGQFSDWKVTHRQPIWKWSTCMARKLDKKPTDKITDPKDWYGENPLTPEEQEQAEKDLQKLKNVQRRVKQKEKRYEKPIMSLLQSLKKVDIDEEMVEPNAKVLKPSPARDDLREASDMARDEIVNGNTPLGEKLRRLFPSEEGGKF